MVKKLFTQSPQIFLGLLLGLMGLAFFTGLGGFHLFDWDEINFAESSREMLVTGDYLHVQVNYLPFWEKPPLFMWLQAISMTIFENASYAARFPNALFGLFYIVTFYWIGKKHFTPQFGLIWAMMMGASLLPHAYFNSGIIDPVFNYFIFLSLYFAIRVFEEREHLARFALLAGIFSGLSVLTKGPVGFLLLGLTLLVYLITKRFNGFPKLKYIVLFVFGLLGMVALWLFWEYTQNGTENLWKFIEYQIELFNSDVAGHKQPFYYHFVVVFLGCFPMSILALPAFKKSADTIPLNFKKWMTILFWVVLILFSLVTTKIVHYSSMTYTPLAFLAAWMIHQRIASNQGFHSALSVVYLVIGCIIGIGITGAIYVFQNAKDFIFLFADPFAQASMSVPVDWNGMELVIGIVYLIVTIVSFLYLKRKQYLKMLVLMLFNTTFSLWMIQLFVVPKIEIVTQGPMLEMVESVANEDCYIETYGFKSYAQYFYGQVKPGHERSLDRGYLLEGPVDKPVYFVSKCTNLELDDHPNFELISAKGGFRMYQRKR